MEKTFTSPLIETNELAKLLAEKPKNLTIVNTNFGFIPEILSFRPADTWSAIFKEERIPTARFVNIGIIGDKSQSLPNMLPTLEVFTNLMKELDIGRNDHIVCYGDEEMIGPCRGYWMFKVYGFPNVQMMNGTFAKWKKEGFSIEKGDETWKGETRERKEEDFKFELNKHLVVYMEDLRSLIKEDKMDTLCLVDARPESKFKGEHPDPKGNKVGHIPGAYNIVFSDFLNPEATLKTPEEIKAIVESKKIDISKPVRTTCGSGMSACVLFMGFSLIGAKDLGVYDGSWAEWGRHAENPVETTIRS
jgi:thiosulfate/3-mercaptopyruvate sulfurtransferase